MITVAEFFDALRRARDLDTFIRVRAVKDDGTEQRAKLSSLSPGESPGGPLLITAEPDGGGLHPRLTGMEALADLINIYFDCLVEDGTPVAVGVYNNGEPGPWAGDPDDSVAIYTNVTAWDAADGFTIECRKSPRDARP